jgi:hypothetical protein
MGAVVRPVEAWRMDSPTASLRLFENGLRWRISSLIRPICRCSGLAVTRTAQEGI